MDKPSETAEIFMSGLNCSQSVLLSYGGVSEELSLRLGSGFGAGLGRSGRICGAVTGAVMSIGLRRGQTSSDEVAKREESYRLSNEFVRRFALRMGSSECGELLGVDLGTEGGQAAFTTQNMKKEKCAAAVSAACEILEDLLKEG